MVDGIGKPFSHMSDTAFEKMINGYAMKNSYGLSLNKKEKCNKGPGDQKFKVVVTQPRKIAAIQMAKRVSHERNS